MAAIISVHTGTKTASSSPIVPLIPVIPRARVTVPVALSTAPAETAAGRANHQNAFGRLPRAAVIVNIHCARRQESSVFPRTLGHTPQRQQPRWSA